MSRFTASLASVLFGLLAWPAHLLAKSGIRFVHAVPGAEEAELTVEQEGRTTLVGRTGYAGRTDVRVVPPGQLRWKLVSGGKTIAEGTGNANSPRITAIAMPQGSRVAVRFFRDAVRSPGGRARVRVIHAAPELGAPDVRVDGRRVARRLGYGEATGYVSLRGSRHDLQAVRAGTRDELVARPDAPVPSGAITNAIVIGTAGEPARIITVSDRAQSGGGEGGESRERRDETRERSDERRQDTGGAAGRYTVKRGDSLWHIARDHMDGSDSDAAVARRVEQLWERNAARIGTGDPNLIFPGQQIVLPG